MSQYPDDLPLFQDEPYGQPDFDNASKRFMDEQEYEAWGDYWASVFDTHIDPSLYCTKAIYLGIDVTEEGFLRQRFINIYRDGHEEEDEHILEIGCDDNSIPV